MKSRSRPPSNARELALAVLDEYQRTAAFVAPLLEEKAHGATLSAPERRLAAEIVYSVVRRQATLDKLIEPHLRRPRHKIEGALWTLMQIGTCQLVFLESVPPHAALNETVETAKRRGKPRWCGFLNGVLQAASRDLSDEFTTSAAADAVPITPGRYRRCRRPVFTDPREHPLPYIAQAFSFPGWLVERWGRRFGFDELTRLGFWFNTPPELHLRVNRLRTSREALLDALRAAGIEGRAGERPEAVRLESSTRVDQLPGFEAGWFSVQDESAMGAAALLSPRPGEMVLDLCAAPGTKTAQLAELMQNQGSILATDVQPERLPRIEENSRRLGLHIIEPTLIRADGADIPAGPFDAVLVDAPCSNSGVLGKRPEARWRLRRQDIDELAELQIRLLSHACDRLKPDGRIVYSTCSIEPEENRQVVQSALLRNRDFQLAEEIEYVPGRPADGGYQALLRRV